MFSVIQSKCFKKKRAEKAHISLHPHKAPLEAKYARGHTDPTEARGAAALWGGREVTGKEWDRGGGRVDAANLCLHLGVGRRPCAQC